MIRKLINICAGIAFVITQPLYAFAGQAILLTDAQLDEVHAGGLNLDFEAFFGNMSSIADNITNSGIGSTTINDKPITVIPSQSAARLIDTLSPVKTTNAKEIVAGEASPLATLPVQSSGTVESPMAASGVQQPTVAPAGVVSIPLQQELPINANVPLEYTTNVPVTGNPEVTITEPSYVPLSMTPEVNTDEVTPVSDSSALANSLVNNEQSSGLSQNEEPSSLSSPAAVESTRLSQAPLEITGVTTSNGRIGVMAFESIGEMVPANVESLTMNSLNISETAQQYLSALNNVNAVGSTVLIQQNLVILINSMVENLNTSNALDMGSFVPLQ